MDLIQNSYIKWALSGLLLGIGFVVPSLWILGLAGGVYFIHTLINESSVKRQLLGATLAWTIKAACANSFFWSVYPVQWLPIEWGSAQLVLVLLYWVTTSLWLSLGALVVVVGYGVCKKYASSLYKHLPLLLVPVFWVVGEMFGSFMFSVMMIGPGGTINVAYSFGYSGYLLAEHALLLQLARLGGVYVLSALFAIVAIGIILVLQFPKTITTTITSFVIGLVFATGWYQYVAFPIITSEQGHSVAVIDTYPGRELSQERSDFTNSIAITQAVEAALTLGGDYILLPEDAQFFNQTQPIGSLRSSINFKYDNPQPVIVDSGPTLVGEKTVLQALIFDGQGDHIDRIHKRYLVPQGEFMPSLYSRTLQLVGLSSIAALLSEQIAFAVGPLTSQAAMSENIPGILFCFESVDPMGVRKLIRERPHMPFVAHPVSHTWFHDSTVLWHQLDTMLQVQAVWNQKYIISASNHAYSHAFAPNGAIQTLEATTSGEGWAVKEVIIPRKN